MLQSKLFPKTLHETPADAPSAGAALLARGGYISKLMAGVFTYQPLGLRVMKKIEAIIRAEMDAIGGQELFMPALQPKELWQRSGRWGKLTGDMYQFKDPSEREIGLAMTHEEVIVDLLGRQSLSYQDLPVALYQFQTKFRYEPRAKSGVLRAREFIMKDLYSVHLDETDCDAYYEQVKQAYLKIFAALDIPVVIALASGGVFSSDFSHEFQSICDIGEDTIYVCPKGDYAVNKEVIDRTGERCPNHKIALVTQTAVEVGNTFKLGTKFSQDMKVFYTAEDGGEVPFHLASYGIGLGRLMGVIVETHHDTAGIIWPKSVAPFAIHLIDLTKTSEERAKAQAVYQRLTKAKVEVLFDDRAVSPGVKFADADLLGLPTRLIVSSKTLEQESVEIKKRSSKAVALVKLDQLTSKAIPW